MAHTPGELTTTLILALSQSQDQVKTLQSQTARIEQLIKENEKLKEELDATRVAREDHDAFPVDHLFQQNVEHRAEILRLKQKLRKYKDKATGRLGIPISSPLSTATTPASPRRPHEHLPVEDSRDDAGTPPVKRRRLEQVDEDNAPKQGHSRHSSTNIPKRNMVEKKVAAIPLLAEDGEQHIAESTETEAVRDKQVLDREGSLYKRLDGLLTVPSPGRAPLNQSFETKEAANAIESAARPPKRVHNISNIHHVPRESVSPNKPGSRKTKTPQGETPTTKAKAQTREKLPPRNHPRSVKLGTALRNVPVNRLRLIDFKPNPRWLDSHGVSYDEFLHGQNKARLEEIAKTMPQRLSDDEILLELLGSGSEERIARMTVAARRNLVEEAKLRRVADAFGKQRTDYDRENDPIGFWEIDMPGTQEQEKNRKLALERERAEIKRRYDDAISGQGRFVFADESIE